MKYAKLAYAVVVFGFLLGIVVPVLTAQANAEGGLSLSPPLQEVTLGPGLLQANVTVTLKNTTTGPVNASYKLLDLKALGTYGGSTLDKAGLSDSYDLANWMTLPAGDSEKIQPNQTAAIKVTIDNRTDLSPGGHYGALVITANAEGSNNQSVSLNQQLVSLIFVKKLGGETYGIDLESFLPDKPSTLPDSVTLHFKDTGNVHITPRGYVQVADSKGNVVSKGIINPDSTLVMPGTSRQFITIMQQTAAVKPASTYTMTIYYRYDGQDQFATRSITFTYKRSPKHLALLAAEVLGVGLLVGMVALFGYRRFRKTARNKRKN